MSVLVPSAEAAPTEAPVVEPQWVLAEGTSSVVSTDVTLLDVAAGAVLVEEPPHLTDPGGPRVRYGSGLAVERRPVVPPGYGTVQLTAAHVVAVDGSGQELHVERLDGSLSTELTLPAGTQYVGATPDGWLEVSAVTSGPGSGAVVLAEAVLSADLTVTREPVGTLLELPAGTVTGVAASVGAADAGRSSVAFVACAEQGDEGQDCALARFDAAAGAVSVLAEGPPGLGAVRAVNGAEVVVETGVWGPTDRITTLRRLGDEGVVAEWTVGIVDDVQDVGGRTTWRLWDRAQQAYRVVEGLSSGAVVPVGDVWWSDGTHRPVLSSGGTAWTTRAGAVVTAGPDGSGLSERVPARPYDLSVTGVDVDGSSVVWMDDSDTVAPQLTTAWRRTIGATGPGARTRVLDRTVGWSIATVGGSTLAYRQDTAGNNRELVRAAGGTERALGVSPWSWNHARALIEAVSEAEVFARHFYEVPWEASRGALVDLATDSLQPLRADAVSADWQAAFVVTYEYPEPPWAIPTSTITAEAREGSATRVVTRPDVAVTDIYLVDSTLVWHEHRGVFQPDEQEDVLLWVDLEDPATEVHSIQLGLGRTDIVATGHGRVAVWAPERSVVEVYEPTVSAAPLFALEVPPSDIPVTEGPRVSLGLDVVAWVVDGEQGDRLVAARIPARKFSDVPDGARFHGDIRWLVEQRITTGYADGTFRPVAPVSRQATAAFLYRAAGSPAFTAPAEASFDDVPVGSVFFTAVEWLVAEEITTGAPGPDGSRMFRPADPVSRQAMAAFLYRALGSPPYAPPTASPFVDVATQDAFYAPIAWLAATAVSTGTTTPDGTMFSPTAGVSRQAMAAFLHRADALR